MVISMAIGRFSSRAFDVTIEGFSGGECPDRLFVYDELVEMFTVSLSNWW